MSKRTIVLEDGIHALPDCVLLHILSFLNIKAVARTSVLSKRWQDIWNSIPTLTFEHHTEWKTGEFVAWVHRTLLRFGNASIEKFKADCGYDHRFASDVDVWVRFAAEEKVGDMSLGLNYSRTNSLPKSVCCNSSLINLNIYGCKLVPMGGLSWSCLKSLSIAFMELNGDTIARVLSSSPMLEFLKITACWGIHHLDINSESLRELVIDTYRGLEKEIFLEISAPSLRSLHLLGYFCRRIRVIGVSYLLRAELNFSFVPGDDGDEDDNYEKQCSYFIELLESLDYAVELELGLWCTQALLLLEATGLPLPLSRLKCLELNAYINAWDVPGIISLLKCSPNLEKLVVNRIRDGSWTPSCSNLFKQVEDYWRPDRRVENFPLPHLKTVKILGFKYMVDIDSFTYRLVGDIRNNFGLFAKLVIPAEKWQVLVTRHSITYKVLPEN